MKIVVRPKVGWRKVTFQIEDETFNQIREICMRHGFRVEEGIKIILLGEFLDYDPGEDVEALRKEVKELEERLYNLEGKWSPLKFSSYGIALDNRNLAIQLSGMIAENKRLREMLGKEKKDYSEIEKLIHYYLSLESG